MPHVKANGVNQHYELTGPAEAPVIVFSHSIGASLEMWDAQVAAFAGRYRCLRYDIRGHGGSEVIDRPAKVDDLADDVAGLLDALAIARAHIVGLSLGGMMGQAFALRHPDRLDRLVLVSTSAKMDALTYHERAALARREGYGSFIDSVLSPRWLTADFAKRSPATIAAFRDRFPRDWRGYAVCADLIAELDLPERIGAIAAPTLIMVGADDPATPVAMSEDLRNRIPGSELIILPRLAHLLTVERPDIANPYIAAFLERERTELVQGQRDGSFEAGLANRKAVLGTAHVERSLAVAGEFGAGWQDFIIRTAWGDAWGDPALAWKTRSLLTLALMTALHREEEFKLHLRPALANGVTTAELAALIRHCAVYAGIPAGNAAMRWTREKLGEELR
jgi:3-oxoadipate enol-lactonase/4-carboxymuconolactone decarboxylase